MAACNLETSDLSDIDTFNVVLDSATVALDDDGASDSSRSAAALVDAAGFSPALRFEFNGAEHECASWASESLYLAETWDVLETASSRTFSDEECSIVGRYESDWTRTDDCGTSGSSEVLALALSLQRLREDGSVNEDVGRGLSVRLRQELAKAQRKQEVVVNKVAVLLVDGMTSDARPLAALAKALIATGYHVTAVLANGFFCHLFESIGAHVAYILDQPSLQIADHIQGHAERGPARGLESCHPSVLLYCFQSRDVALRYEACHATPAVLVNCGKVYEARDYPVRPSLQVDGSAQVEASARSLDWFVTTFVETGAWQAVASRARAAKASKVQ